MTPPETNPTRNSLARGLDAGLNRLSEALRTIEDRLRFDRLGESTPWRHLRREAGALRQEIEARWGALGLWRDVAGDPGAPDAAAAARAHAGLEDLLAANVSRAREAARSVEEALRVGLPELAARAEAIRYGIYGAEGVAIGRARRAPRLDDVRLYVLLTTHLASRPPLETAEAAIAGGAQMIQLREKEMPARDFLALARDLRELTARHDVLLIINDRIDIAALCHADGVHQGQEDLSPAEARHILGPDAIVGVSTHGADQARAAAAAGADYIGVGPIFPTRTKEHRSAVGTGYIAEAAAAAPIPGFAIGSVNRESLPEVIAAGARRVAICTGIIAAEDIEGAARAFREQLDRVAAGPVEQD